MGKNYSKSRRGHGKIETVTFGMDFDHNILSSWITFVGEGGSQAMGGGSFQTQHDLSDYIRDLCDAFGVATPEDLEGEKCYALRETDNFTSIVGLESVRTGKRFLHQKWFANRYPTQFQAVVPRAIDKKRLELESKIAFHLRTLDVLEAELENLKEEDYTDWNNES